MLGKLLVTKDYTAPGKLLGATDGKVLVFVLGLVLDLEGGTLMAKLLGTKAGCEVRCPEVRNTSLRGRQTSGQVTGVRRLL